MKLPRPEARRTGIVVALSALRSGGSPAAGEFPDLLALGELARSWGFDLIQLLPVNDTGGMSSPYTALSAFALHPLYIRAEDLPEVRAKPSLADKFRALSLEHAEAPRFDYGRYSSAKLALLEEVFRASVGKSDAASWISGLEGFVAWQAANGWVLGYSVFSELKRRYGGLPWWSWREDRDPSRERVEALWRDPVHAAGTRFFAWLQFRAEAQFRAAAEGLAKLGVGILGDIPILIGKDSAEVWAERGLFGLGLSAGSPPDAENPLGQNWGFPVYDWEALAREDFRFWRDRLTVASRFYSAYRIDHVLGFFRIWTLGERERSGYLGRFAPTLGIEVGELEALGFDPPRRRWLSRPHLPFWRLLEAAGNDAALLHPAMERLFDRIGAEDLYLFKDGISGELDIEAALEGGSRRLCDFILSAWRDRALLEYEKGRFVPTWNWRGTTAWASLSEGERRGLEELFAAKRSTSERIWDEGGRRILGELLSSSDMLPTAEDLGGIPPYVPRALADLGILGLRVFRWTRRWEVEGQPIVAPAEWPETSVACPSVHDSSALRDWWEREADRPLFWSWAARALGRDLGEAPPRLGSADARLLLEAVARVNSRFAVYPIQDLLAMSPTWSGGDPHEERVNVPGTDNAWNWGYRLPTRLEGLSEDVELRKSALALVAARGLRA